MATLPLKCKCGAVQGEAINVTSRNGNRVVCCCADCQAFAEYLGKEDVTLDAFGGTDVYQTSMAQVKIHNGKKNLQSMRLSKKGLLRWYTSCCNTPVGNTINAKTPLIGIIHTFMDIKDRGVTLGNVRAHVQTQHAKGVPNYTSHHPQFSLGIKLLIIQKLILWKIQGKHKPTVFFNDEGRPLKEPINITE